MKEARPKTPKVEPFAIPGARRETKSKVIPIRVSKTSLAYLESELAKLGLKSPRDRQDFYRGALYAGLTNAKRARSIHWRKFIDAIQDQARKHLGMGLDLNDAQEIADAGHVI